MKNQKINEKLINKLQKIIETQQLTALINKYRNQVKSQDLHDIQCNDGSKQQNSIANKHRRLTSQSKQKLLLRRKQSKKQTKKQAIQQDEDICQQKISQSQQKLNGKPIKDKAIYINLKQIPYLHSTDLLNHLYKKPTALTQQDSEPFLLYNPPANNPYALTKVKYLNIYYCKIESLRDMGTGWSNLIQLSVYFGGLKDLSGLNAFPSLQYLHCPFNSISTISDLMFHPTLVSVDFQSNLISDFSQVEHIFTVDNLEYINLSNNPVYQSKQNKRKIQQKFDKIIQSENNRLEQYVNEQKRQIWELQNIQGIQYCNNILKQFFSQTKTDQITVQSKHQLTSQNFQHTDFDFQTFQANFNNEQKNQQPPKNNKKQFKIEYFLPEIPEDQYFQQMILKGNIEEEKDQATYCEEKIYLTPLIQMINKNQIYIGPILDKYLKNKLFIKDQNAKIGKTINQEHKQMKNDSQISKPKRISKLSMTAFSSKGFSSMGSSEMTINEDGTLETQKSKQFATTASSFSTNYTNMNNTSTSFSMRRSRIGLTKSKQKSISKISMIKNAGESFNFHQVPTFDINNLNSSSLAKQSRIMIGRSLKKQVKELNEKGIDKSNIKNLQRSHIDQHPNQKTVFSSALKRKSLLNHSKKQKTSTLIRKQMDG